jgi:hypothetical protein
MVASIRGRDQPNSAAFRYVKYRQQGVVQQSLKVFFDGIRAYRDIPYLGGGGDWNGIPYYLPSSIHFHSRIPLGCVLSVIGDN